MQNLELDFGGGARWTTAHVNVFLLRGGYDLVAVGVQECSYRIGPQHEGAASTFSRKHTRLSQML